MVFKDDFARAGAREGTGHPVEAVAGSDTAPHSGVGVGTPPDLEERLGLLLQRAHPRRIDQNGEATPGCSARDTGAPSDSSGFRNGPAEVMNC
jgi:hypothetical protein